ncbi:VOC family protein [Conexibacter arvalis]|uniref:Catechol 2,3-dioxygenase-like lactoylglutathione lyase family enzyme n=1 Tax=Conexibacter arvalis TaxID=912552 RepID=A0A840ID30_9ACTN|nr:VOC family protein [Conexibacter arvalis]MBB4661974.1 catechol 2,3-dioxygenase-like lactoylglutathione lyase family enzyme [Conexibacter arvalis]
MTTSAIENWDWSRPVFDHLHLRVADLAASRAFYLAALRPLGIPLLIDTPETVQFPNLALSADGEPSARVHVAFVAADEDAVAAFHAAGVAAGGRDNGAPGPRRYGPPGSTYHAAYVLDPDGNNVEAVFRSFGG